MTASNSTQPSSAELARELAERNNRCAHIKGDSVCLRVRGHSGECKYEPADRIIPIR